MDIIRVFRILEYVGPRDVVMHTLANSIQGERQCGAMTIKASTLGTYPEIMHSDQVVNVEQGSERY